jgi:glycosyltransferase involved in cell wall biosynthesis
MTARSVVIVPAFNEEASIGGLIDEIRRYVPEIEIVIINDGSSDRTPFVAAAKGATVLDLPCNLGVGGAVQAGFRYAFDQGYECVVRCDGDGQHDPSGIPGMLDALNADAGVDLIIGSRFLSDETYSNTIIRSMGIRALSWMLTVICRKRVTDPTSGFQVVRRPLLYLFSRSYPTDYPEPEALALLRRQGYDYKEVPAVFRNRQAGQSSIRGWGTLYYVIKVFLALLIDRARPIDLRYSRSNVAGVV